MTIYSFDLDLDLMTLILKPRLPRVREMSGKNKIFSRSGKSQGIWKKMSGKFGHLAHVRELSGNFVMSCQGIVREFVITLFFTLKFPPYDKGSTLVVFM